MQLTLLVLAESLTIVRLDPQSEIPSWAPEGSFSSLTRTADELSIVCSSPPGMLDGANIELGWRCLKVARPLDFGLVGIMANLSSILAAAGVSLFALSTYDTDYLLVKADRLPQAIRALADAGHMIQSDSVSQ